jgi:hypothetical protein
MIAHAITASAPFLSDPVRAELTAAWSAYARRMRQNTRELRNCQSAVRRRWLLLQGLFTGSLAAREHVKARLHRAPRWPEEAPELISNWLRSTGGSAALLAA